ncbi:hypothetical protein INT43_008397 [Umbelopsis isabellina]|uniref:Zn(2)-C6 fungal-type domain-containing protein n=1 Tax=Mortierella isabellina TaxID=91625 RepID=A0A8H7UI90_MORIS|nr:hypothetical protein INT43_008397 [Umbelopsis isabellina]
MLEKETGQHTRRKRNHPCNECRFHRRKCNRPNDSVSCERCIRLKRECVTATQGMDGDDTSSADQDSMVEVNPGAVIGYNEQLKEMENQLLMLERALMDAKVAAKITYTLEDSEDSTSSCSTSSPASSASYNSSETSASETSLITHKKRKTSRDDELRDPIVLTMTKNGLTLETNVKNIDDFLSFGLQALQYLDGSSLYTKPGVDMKTIALTTTSRTNNIQWIFREALRRNKGRGALVPQFTGSLLFDAENVITNLVAAFFHCYNSVHPFLHADTYYKKYHKNGDLTDAPLTATICAVMTQRSCAHIHYEPFEMRNMGEYFYQIARDALSDIMDDTSRQPEASIGFLLLSQYCFFTLRFSEARHFSSMAYIIAHDAVKSIIEENTQDPEQVIMKRNYLFLNFQEMALKHFLDNSNEFLDVKLFDSNLITLPDDGEIAKIFLKIANRAMKFFRCKQLIQIMEQIHDAHCGKVSELSLEAFFELQKLIEVFWNEMPIEERFFHDPYDVERQERGYELFQNTTELLPQLMFHQFQLAVHSCFIPTEETYATADQTSTYSMYTNAIHNQAMRICLDSSKAVISMSQRVADLGDVCKFDRDFLLGVLETLAVLTNCPDKCVANEADMVSVPHTLTMGHKPDSDYVDIPRYESSPSPTTIIMWESMVRSLAQLVDRRPVDPPPVIQLELLLQSDSSVDRNLMFESPCLFMCATLLPVHDGIASNFELETTIRSATGCMVSSLNHLKDLNDDSGAFFVFPDISVRVDGVYRFRMTLFEITGDRVRCRDSIDTEPFTVFPAKKFPGMEESTSLSRLFAEQGLKIRIRKELRSKRKKDTSQQSGDQEVSKFESEPVSSSNQSKNYQGGDVRGENLHPFTSNALLEMSSVSPQQSRNIPAPRTITLPRNILDTHARTNLPFPPTYASSTYSTSTKPDAIIPEPSLFLDRSSSVESSQIPPNRSLPRLPSIERSNGQHFEEEYQSEPNYQKRFKYPSESK